MSERGLSRVVEDACLRRWWAVQPVAEIARRLGCTEAEVERRARRLRLGAPPSPAVRARRRVAADRLNAMRSVYRATTAALTPRELDDYRTFRRHGWRRAEALAAIGRGDLA